ncbi:MAG: hypothetical protein KY397_00465 [Gemmatimonadetes bacterium]|nr:hypothetical protein [Gemmatimonadota bacterium]
MRKGLRLTLAPAALAALTLAAGAGSSPAQSMAYEPTQGEAFRYRTATSLVVTQQVLERENHYTLESSGLVRLTLLSPGPRQLWRLGFDELTLRIQGAFPTPRTEGLRGTVVTLATTPQGVVLDAIASGIVTPGLGSQYVERAAAAFLPHLPTGAAPPGVTWTDTLTVTEVLRGVTAEVRTVVRFTVGDTAALAGRPVIPVEYRGDIEVGGSGTVDGSRISLEGSGEVRGSYLYDPAEELFALHEQEQVLESTLFLMDSDRGSVAIPSRQTLSARAERLY